MPARLTVVDTLYYERPGKDPVAVVARYSRELPGGGQEYVRELEAGGEAVSLDFGWVEDAAAFVVKNEGGRDLELGCGPVTFLIPPKESFRATPAGRPVLVVRSPSGPCRFTLTVFPG